MALPKTKKTKYTGIGYYNDPIKGKVYVGTFTIDKKKYRKIFGYENDQFRTNEKIAFINKEKMRNEIINEVYSFSSKDLSFNELWENYLDHIKNSQAYAQNTISAKVSAYNQHFKAILGIKKIKHIKNLDIQKLANHLLKTKKPKTVENYISDLSMIFKFGIKHNFLNYNPALDIELPKYNNIIPYPLTTQESKRLFQTIVNYDEPLYKGIFTFLLNGRRKDEVLSMTWDKIDLINRTYIIEYEVNKISKNMTYYINDDLYSILINIEDKKGLVFKSPKTGKKLQNIRYAFDRILKAATINKHFRIHDLRHLIGDVSANELNNSLEVTATVLGQTSTRSTKRYSKVRQDTASKTLDAVFDFLRK